MALSILLSLCLVPGAQGLPPAGSTAAAAPQTRADEVRAQREAKSRRLEAPERRPLEAVLFEIEDDLIIERVLNPPRGVYLRLGGIGEGAGFGAGPAYRYRTGAFEFGVSAAGSLKRYVIGEARLILPGTVDDGPYVELYARRRDFPQEDFFGLGPDSLESRRTSFSLRDTLVRPSVGLRAGDVRAGVGAGFLSASTSPGTDARIPSIEEVFTAASTPGLSADQTFLVVDPFVELDLLDPPLNPKAGGKYRFGLARYADRDSGRFSFTRWDLDLRQYVPFFGRTRVLALRALLSSSDPDAGDAVPFYLAPTLGGSYSLRAYRTFRFRDLSAVLFQAEYRWRVNEFVQGALFYDGGAVAPRLGDLHRLESDAGIGLRAGGREGIVFRIDLAIGNEGPRLLLRFDDVF